MVLDFAPLFETLKAEGVDCVHHHAFLDRDVAIREQDRRMPVRELHVASAQSQANGNGVVGSVGEQDDHAAAVALNQRDSVHASV